MKKINLNGIEIPVYESDNFQNLLEGILENPVEVKTSVGKLLFSSLYFYKEGKLNGGLLEPLQKIKMFEKEIPISEISFYKNGKVQRFITQKDITIKGINYPAFNKILLNENETINNK